MDGKRRKPDQGLSYRDSGVDVDAQEIALHRIKALMAATRTEGVLSELGSFGGLFELDLEGLKKPVLVSSTDGVGTKLKVAFETGIHNTIGHDLVNHCVNDILVQGARPLFFMDYVACGHLEPNVLAEIVEGVANGCRDAGCALLGGETAEMPGFYGDGEYDIAGFIVGVVDRRQIIDGNEIRAGQLLIGLPSAGLHTNGYSLARKIFFEVAGLTVGDEIDVLEGSVGEALLGTHRSYRNQLLRPIADRWIKGLVHITGGGMTDNIPRVLPPGLSVQIQRGTWPVPPIFHFLQQTGRVLTDEMYRVFNMGVGMIAICDPDEAVLLECHLDRLGKPHHRIGQVVKGGDGVIYV